MLLVDAIYINNSGGKSLLVYLVDKLLKHYHEDIFFLFDKRSEGDFYGVVPFKQCTFVQAGYFSRLATYRRIGDNITRVFCFGNFPPPIPLTIPVYTYFHNVSLLEQPQSYSLKEKLLKRLKGMLLWLTQRHTDCFFVQSEQVATQLKDFLGLDEACVKLFPFFDSEAFQANNKHPTADSHYCYISNANSHKNHGKLLEAWVVLAAAGYRPTLHLTITNNNKRLLAQIAEAIAQGADIVNHGFIHPQELFDQCDFLVYPSLMESFGLPLVEAIQGGCKVLAADRPYTHAVIKPTDTFDPDEVSSLVACIKRNINEPVMQHSFAVVEDKVHIMIDFISK